MSTLRATLAVTLCLHLTSAVGYAQGPGVGFRIAGTNSSHDVIMFDNAGTVVHTWATAFQPGFGIALLDDGTLLRAIETTVVPGILGGTGGGIQRLALDGTVLWDWRHDTPGNVSHHDIEPLPNGNVLMIAWEDKSYAEGIAAGRDPALFNSTVMRPDTVIEVRPTGPTTGAIVWEWHVWDHLIQDVDPIQDNFGVIADHPELVDVNFPPNANGAIDWNHMNGIDYDPVHDLIVVSAHNQSEIWVIDHSTTTAEAAGSVGGARGHGGDLLYRWGNPRVYGAGTTADQQLFGQHSPEFIGADLPGAGNMLVFNNNAPGGSQVVEITPPQDGHGDYTLAGSGVFGPLAPTWTHAGGFHSPVLSSAQRLPNGNTLVCSGSQALILEVRPDHSQAFSKDIGSGAFHVRYTERTLWADTEQLSASAGGAVGFDLIGGSAQAGQSYYLLGSVSGTSPGFTKSGVHVPLNWDVYTDLTLAFANTAVLTNTFGSLDGVGRASASLNLAPGLLPPTAVGAVLRHAFVAVHPASSQLTWASNAVDLLITP